VQRVVPRIVIVGVLTLFLLSGVISIHNGPEGVPHPASATVAGASPSPTSSSERPGHPGSPAPVLDRGPIAAARARPAGRLAGTTNSVISGGAANVTNYSAGSVIDTLVLSNGTLVPGNVLPASGGYPVAVAYDSANGYVYVANYGSNNVAVINATTDKVVDWVPVGVSPDALVYDNANGYVYVANYNYDAPGNVTVINGATDKVVGSIGVDNFPDAVAFDSGTGCLYVVSEGKYPVYAGTVTVINGAKDKVVGSVPVGTEPWAVAYDGSNGDLYVANGGSNNVTIVNGATNKAVGSVPAGTEPDAVAYDRSNGYLYVVNEWTDNATVTNGPGNLTVINGATDQIVGSVPVGFQPVDVALDSSNGYLYVANMDIGPGYGTDPDGGPGNLTVVDGSTDAVVGSVPVSPIDAWPDAVAYDSGNGDLYVANGGSNNVTIVNGATNTPIGTVTLDTFPDAVVYDSANGYLFVADRRPNGEWAINGSTDAVVRSVPGGPGLGRGTHGEAYDTANGDIYVADCDNDNVSVINGSRSTVVGSVPVGWCPDAVAYDSANGYIYVTDSSSSNVTVIDGSTGKTVGSVSVGPTPDAVAYDSANGHLYVADEGDDYGAPGNVEVINGSTDQVVGRIGGIQGPVAVAYDSSNGYVYVANGGLHVIDGATDQVVGSVPVVAEAVAYDSANGFVYVAGDDNVTAINGATDTVAGSVVVGYGPVALAYDGANGYVYVVNEGSGSVSIIEPSVSSPPPTYPVTFAESGIPGGLEWGVTIDQMIFLLGNTTDATSLSTSLPNGSYPYYAWATNGTYSTLAGTVVVDGAAVAVSVVFGAMDFAESGLARGMTWYVNVTNGPSLSSSGSSLSTRLPNGTYHYVVGLSTVRTKEYVAPSGSFTVTSAGGSTTIDFVRVQQVTFREKNLPPGTEWWVNLSGNRSTSSTGTALIIDEPKGTYSFTVGSANKSWAGSPGRLSVGKSPVAKTVRFVLQTFKVTLGETGLPGGSQWCVAIAGGKTYCSRKASLSFLEPNGTYDYTLTTRRSGYSALGGLLTVTGAAVSKNVTFST